MSLIGRVSKYGMGLIGWVGPRKWACGHNRLINGSEVNVLDLGSGFNPNSLGWA